MAGVKTGPRRAYGTGFVEKVTNGWRWRKSGKASRVWPTEALALVELDKVVADPTFVPEASLPRAMRARKSRRVADTIHLPRAPKRQRQVFAAPPEVEAIPEYTDRQVDAAERLIDRADQRWARRRRADGRRVCVPCKGTGVDGRPGPGQGRACLNCWGGDDA